MIFDSVKNAGLYAPISKNLASALAYMKDHDVAAMEPGKYEVCDGVTVTVKKGYQTKPAEGAKWESHRRDIDIQYMLDGAELIGVCGTDLLEEKIPYGSETDQTVWHNEDGKGFFARLNAGDFLILFPDDAHATVIDPGERMTCSKAIFKVRID